MKYLITGGAGNIACQLTHILPADAEVLLTDIASEPLMIPSENSRFESSDICDPAAVEQSVALFKPDIVLHFASLLSGQSEDDRTSSWNVNMQGAFSVLEASLRHDVSRVIFLSSLASFGSPLPDPVPEDYPQWPRGFYGFTKAAIERLGYYYRTTLGLDFRALRLPIIISPFPSPGAASSYASNVFIAAVREGRFVMQVRPTSNPALMYIKDCLHAIHMLTHAESSTLTRSSYNLFACAPTAEQLVAAIQHRLPDAEIEFQIDDQVADLIDSWPRQIDDTAARTDWNWQPRFTLSELTDDFLSLLQNSHEQFSQVKLP